MNKEAPGTAVSFIFGDAGETGDAIPDTKE
jgi:hypothetical protein